MKEIPLTQGYIALVDDEDYDLLRTVRWHVKKERWTNYAVHSINNRQMQMHCVVMGLQEQDARDVTKLNDSAILRICKRVKRSGKRADHKDGNGLNNQRSNLRLATISQNNQNRTRVNGAIPFKGVSFNRQSGKFQADIHSHTLGHRYLGRFNTAEEAARIYDVAARELFGEFATTNTDIGLLKD